ncbi:hypothetical protein [Sulfuriflexus mobilis]|uniref:hypothetical protein n=1 Tax=Sulfuriflexus mobilis TaxID=1811807 RepID=UPI000F822FBF|nr:hypothetical protein [Sulfuriflexus mobilis]
MATATAAAEREGLFELHMVRMADGLVTAEPKLSQQELDDALAECRHLIHARSHRLEDYIEENRITAKTGIVAAVMPGGLIYLAVRKSQLNDANAKLENLQADMDNLQSDTLALHVEEAPILVARFP